MKAADRSSLLARYSVALLAALGGAVLRVAFDWLFGGGSPLLFLPISAFLAGQFGGVGPGLASTAFSLFLIWFVPADSFDPRSAQGTVQIVACAAVGAAMSAVGGWLKQTREALQRGEQRTRVLVEGVGDVAIIGLGRDGRIESWNSAATRIKGYSAAEAIGQRLSMFYTAEDKAAGKAEALLRDAEQRGTVRGAGWRVRKDGSRFWAEFSLSAIRDHQGRLTGYSKLTRDMTEEHARRGALQESEQTTRALLESAGQGILGIDADGRIVLVNQMAERLFGYTRAELTGESLELLVPDALRAQHRVHRENYIANPHARPMGIGLDLCARRKDGALFPVEISLNMVQSGRGPLAVCFVTDITERKKHEETVRRQASLLEQALDPVLSWEPGGAIQTWNRGAEALYGYSRAEAVGRASHQLLGTGDRRIEIETALSSGGEWRGELAHRAKDGRTVLVESAIRLLREPDGRCIALQSDRDITDRKHAEEEIRSLNAGLEQRVSERTAQLEAANRELEAFSYSVSHDLRAPLRGIDGWSLALLDDYGSHLDEGARRCLDRVRSETQRMGLLIDDLLQLSRVTRVEMKVDGVDLSGLAHTIAARLREGIPGRRIEFEIEPGLHAAGDPRLLEVALSNLLANAVKFTSPRDPARIQFARAGDDHKQVFVVRDNGVGFDMRYAGTLFGAFQRLHKASEFPGTGIGLATVQRIIRRHGGRVWAESEPGKGASFYFAFRNS